LNIPVKAGRESNVYRVKPRTSISVDPTRPERRAQRPLRHRLPPVDSLQPEDSLLDVRRQQREAEQLGQALCLAKTVSSPKVRRAAEPGEADESRGRCRPKNPWLVFYSAYIPHIADPISVEFISLPVKGLAVSAGGSQG